MITVDLDQQLIRLSDQKQAWLQVSLADRMELLHQCRIGMLGVAEAWVDQCCRAKGLDPQDRLAGEEWLTGPMVTIRYLRLLEENLQAAGQQQPQRWFTCSGQRQLSGSSDQWIAEVFPGTRMEQILWLGYRAEVWIQPNQRPTQGQIYQSPSSEGRVALVLGAGNVSSIPPTDSLTKLFAENQVVILKLNPVNAYLAPLLNQAFAPLIETGCFSVVTGDSNTGRYLCHHPRVDTIHITGSHHTHDRILWGDTETEQAQRKATHQPLLSKPITSELGCVTPILIVPGFWSTADLKFQSHRIATMLANNASFNCTAAQVVITAKDWDQRQVFLDHLRHDLAHLPPRPAYYPGSQQRYQTFLDHYPQAEILGSQTSDSIPWTLIPNLSIQPDEYALTQEAFCGILAEAPLAQKDPAAFLNEAVQVANQILWGTLSCVIVIDPRTAQHHREALQEAISTLRYGAIGINVWSGVIYSLMVTPWGGYPGQPLSDIQSGQGWVHNTYLFDHPQKAVAYGPFRSPLTPVWFVRHRSLRSLGQRLTDFEANPSWLQLPSLITQALRD